MIIHNSITSPAPLTGRTSPTNLAPRTASTPGQVEQNGGDHAQISDLAQLAGDSSKISRLQAAFELGTYHVSPGEIAGALIREATLS
jgi:anti-sigma28 factor (negative regulator of flagellin synthesis)